MKMKIIDGKKIAEEILSEIKIKIKEKNLKLKLATILAGDNPASHLYVSLKEKKAKQIGIGFEKYILEKSVGEKEIIDLIMKLNIDKSARGILVQMPLPEGLDANKIISAIDSEKDVDGLLPNSNFESPFILSIWESLKYIGVNLENKKILALVNSEIFGDKLKSFFNNKGAKLEYHKGLKTNLKEADILITALGCSNCVKGDMIKKGAILIDGGISKNDKKIAGDVDANSAARAARWLTPAPGGVGPITIAMIFRNLAKDCY